MKIFAAIIVPAILPCCTNTLSKPEETRQLTTTTVKSGSKYFPCQMTVTQDKDYFTVTATVHNQTDRTVSFVKNSNHTSISIYAADRNKDEVHNPVIISIPRAEAKDITRVAPGGSTSFTHVFRYKRSRNGHLLIYDDFSIGESYLEIRDTILQANFSYGWYPDYLPKEHPPESVNYVRETLAAAVTFTPHQ